MAASSSLVAGLILLVVVAAVGYSEAYGEPSSTRPSYQERTFASLVNAARVGTPNPLPSLSYFPSSPLHHHHLLHHHPTSANTISRWCLSCVFEWPGVLRRPMVSKSDLINLTTASTTGPAGYRTTYMTGLTTTGILTAAAKAPLYVDPLLSQTARAHSTDLVHTPHSTRMTMV
jgi:hypothetical protein